MVQGLRLNSFGNFAKLTAIRRYPFPLDGHRSKYDADCLVIRVLSVVAVSIVEFKRAKLLQDTRLSGITLKDIARALATMAGVKAVSDFDAG
jgi:hypothetical protein